MGRDLRADDKESCIEKLEYSLFGHEDRLVFRECLISLFFCGDDQRHHYDRIEHQNYQRVADGQYGLKRGVWGEIVEHFETVLGGASEDQDEECYGPVEGLSGDAAAHGDAAIFPADVIGLWGSLYADRIVVDR